jgi:hypothetical protein
MITQEHFVIVLGYDGKELRIEIVPVNTSTSEINPDETPSIFEIMINDTHSGIIFFDSDKWISADIHDNNLVDNIGKCIEKIYLIKKLFPEYQFSPN